MLLSLHIENFAIVSKLDLDFSSGMTAFTGETGAGKSIMIDALMLALGGRADTSVIRNQAEKCEITAAFSIDPNGPPGKWLQEQDIDTHEGMVYLRRVLYSEGRSKSYINGLPASLQQVKTVSELLVDIHGQHQHQTLLNHQTHRQQLDQYAKHQHLLDEVDHIFHQMQTKKNEIEQFNAKNLSNDELTLIQYQYEDLKKIDPKEDEIRLLNQEHQMLHHAKAYIDTAFQITNHLNGEESSNICQLLHHILNQIQNLPNEHKNVKSAQELLQTSLIQCQEALDEIELFASNISLDPERLYEVENRLSALHQLARKCHVDVQQLPNFMQELEQKLLFESEKTHYFQQLESEYHQLEKKYAEAAAALHNSRKTYAPQLAKEITNHIQQLGMPKGYIQIEITPIDTPHALGLDKIEYLVCTNPGMEPDRLSKIASGGELSRIGLAIHMITAKRSATPTLLFDEVDVGIGGATAAIVGQLLRKLADRLQIFCVTHQPQVAAYAHHHFVVTKETKQNQTYSHVLKLNTTARRDEIARMLSGLVMTDQTLSHAQELIDQCQYN